jgi:hypothetical protein
MSVESAISFPKDEWAGVLADIKAADMPSIMTLISTARKIVTRNRVVLHWEEKVDLNLDRADDLPLTAFLDIALNHNGERLSICMDDTDGTMYVTDDRMLCNSNLEWQAAQIFIPSEELSMAEHERVLPKVIKLAMEAGVTREHLSMVFHDELNWRENKDEVLDAYIEKAGIDD